MKTPKFTIAINDMVENSGQFIVHMRDPVFFAEIYEHESKEEQSEFHNQLIEFQEKNNISLLVGRDRDFFQPFSLVCTVSTQEMVDMNHDNLAKIMRRMADWYQSYIIWEEK